MGRAGYWTQCSAVCTCSLPSLYLMYLVVVGGTVSGQSMSGAICISVPCVPGVRCRRLRYSRWWQTYRICTAQHQLNNGPRRCFPTENPHVHIRNASVSLKKKTTTAKELNYSPLPRSFNIFLNRITNLPEITDGVYTFCKQVSCFCMSSQTCRSNMSLPACSFYYCLTLKKNTTEYEAGVPLLWWSRLNVCLHVVSFFFTCYFCTSFNTEWIFFFFVLYLLLPPETPMYMLFGSPGVLRNLLLFSCIFKTAGLNACT